MKIKRLLAMLIDYIIAIIISMIISIIVSRGRIPFNIDFYMYLGWILFTLKDIVFKNYSIGKKKFGLEIKTEKNDIPNLAIILLRNVSLILLPIEIVLIILFNKRFGDIIFKTKIVEKV